MYPINKVRDVAVDWNAKRDVTDTVDYKKYQQSRLARCVKIARDARMTYGEAERAGLFKGI